MLLKGIPTMTATKAAMEQHAFITIPGLFVDPVQEINRRSRLRRQKRKHGNVGFGSRAWNGQIIAIAEIGARHAVAVIFGHGPMLRSRDDYARISQSRAWGAARWSCAL